MINRELAKTQADSGMSLSEGRSGVGLIAQSLRDICYTLLQLTNDQQVCVSLCGVFYVCVVVLVFTFHTFALHDRWSYNTCFLTITPAK